MLTLAASARDVAAPVARYARLLGYPEGHVLTGRPAQLAARARAWYREHGRPWQFARVARAENHGGGLAIAGMHLDDCGLLAELQAAAAETVVLAAVSAGPELDAEAQRHWREGRPDDYFFLERYGAAVVEQLLRQLHVHLADWAQPQQLQVLAPRSPGHQGWSLSGQQPLLELLQAGGPLPGPLDVLASGALRPKLSQLAVFGLARCDVPRLLTRDLVPCLRCPLLTCEYRRSAEA